LDSKEWIRRVGRWWYPARDFAANMLMYAASFALLVMGAMYGTVLITFASRVIASKFILDVFVFLEYAAVLVDGIFILMHLYEHLREGFRRVIR